MALPVSVRKFFGHALNFAQCGEQHDAAEVLKGFGGAGVLEVVEDDTAGTYRAVYTVKFREAVFVLHCFQKQSKSGISTPKKRDGNHSRQAGSGLGGGKGDTRWPIAALTVSR